MHLSDAMLQTRDNRCKGPPIRRHSLPGRPGIKAIDRQASRAAGGSDVRSGRLQQDRA